VLHGMGFLPRKRIQTTHKTLWSPKGKPVAPLCFADSLCERRDLVVRHPARLIPLYLNPCDGPHSSTAKAVAFCERGKESHGRLHQPLKAVSRKGSEAALHVPM